MAASDFVKIYETVLSTPGMNDAVKIELKIPRRNIFLLAKTIERGLADKPDALAAGALATLDEETLQHLRDIPGEFLKRAGLTDMDEKLKALK